MYIQMVTALVLQLIQCVVHLPSDRDMFDDHDGKVEEQNNAYTSHAEHLLRDIMLAHLHLFSPNPLSSLLFFFLRWIKMC